MTSPSRRWTRSIVAFLLLGRRAQTLGQTWCGKNYMENQTVVPPDGKFPDYAQDGDSKTTVLTFRCRPGIRPYLPEDVDGNPEVIISSSVTDLHRYPDSQTYTPPPGWPGPYEPGMTHNLAVTVTIDGEVVATTVIPAVPRAEERIPGSTTLFAKSTYRVPLDLDKLQPRSEHYVMECSGRTEDGQVFNATERLSYLPDPPSGSVTKMDLQSGALLARKPDGTGDYELVFPIGFYTKFDDYLNVNPRSLINRIVEEGFNVIHPIPPFTNLTALDELLDAMEDSGIYLQYDMRWSYQNSTAVTEEVNRIKNRKNLLLWYTADEPDGPSDPLDATVKSYNLINSLDGGDASGGSGYHPISLVLNCQDYHFEEYASGADIIMADVYPIGNDVSFSSEYNTECTPDFGVCGCDNCEGSLADVSQRLSDYEWRKYALNWEGKAIWSVPQAFGEAQYWKRYPTGREFVSHSALSVINGATGLIAWTEPTTPEIRGNASEFSRIFSTFSSFLVDPDTFTFNEDSHGISFRTWTRGSNAVSLFTNTRPDHRSLTLNDTMLSSLYRGTKYFPRMRYLFGVNATDMEGSAEGAPVILESVLHFEGYGTVAFFYESDMTGSVGNGTITDVQDTGCALLKALCLFLVPVFVTWL